MSQISNLQKHRTEYQPKLPQVFIQNGLWLKAKEEPMNNIASGVAEKFPNTSKMPLVTLVADHKKNFPIWKVGVIFSGGQAPGGHNVVAGLFDALKAMNSESQLYGFLGGPSGLIDNKYELLTMEKIIAYRNTGGFDMIGSGRTKLEKEEQFEKVAENCKALGIQAICIVGGDDSNTNACSLAEYFLKKQICIQIIGCPKTIDGDLKNSYVEASFGFDTATKVYGEIIGNIMRDALSAKKYWHFIRLMGRDASHITLECALTTHPNIAVISEEVAAKGQTLNGVVEYIAGIIRDRAKSKMDFGVALIPEGLIEFMPDVKKLMSELNELLAAHEEVFKSLSGPEDKVDWLKEKLSPELRQVYGSLPETIQKQLILDRDPHGNVQVSLIETEKMLAEMVGKLLQQWKNNGTYAGKFSTQCHFFGYEGRCAFPSNFDADYGYSLGYTSAALIALGFTGYIALIRNLAQPAAKWTAGGLPLASMLHQERRHGKDVMVIKKALVEIANKPYKSFAESREEWGKTNNYISPGPIQYFGPSEICDQTTITLALERS